MRGSLLRALALGVAMLPATPIPAAVAAAVKGKPRIIDGETLAIAGQRFRLDGIRAPALDQVCHRAGEEYACGKVARAALWDLVGGREVSCAPAADAGSPAATAADASSGSPAAVSADAGAIAATCTAGDTNLNEGMVAAGWALADPPGRVPYDQFEEGAKVARRGLWTGEFDPPRTWRERVE